MTANAGALTFRIEVPGRATHGSTRYVGVSAVDAYLPIHRALARLEARRNTDVDPLMSEYPIPYPLSVGTVRAATGPAACPTCWWPREDWASGWARIRPRRAPNWRRAWPKPARTTPGCARTPPG